MIVEYVIEKDFKGMAQTALGDGVCPYSYKTKDQFLAEGFLVVDEAGFMKVLDQYIESICGHWKEITEEQYQDALEVLPPVQWSDGGFFISETLISDASAFYQYYKARFFTSNQRMTTPREKIMDGLRAFAGDHLDVAFPTVLTTENARYASTIQHKDHPEWGTKCFNYNAQPLLNGNACSTIGSRCLFENEYPYWEVITWK